MQVSRSVIKGGFGDAELPPRRFEGTVEQVFLGEHQGASVYIVHFYDGARTYVHSHGEGQILIILRGTAQIGTVADGVIEELTAGDMVHAPAGELHWHGAAPGSDMTNLSITLGPSIWQGPPPIRTT